MIKGASQCSDLRFKQVDGVFVGSVGCCFARFVWTFGRRGTRAIIFILPLRRIVMIRIAAYTHGSTLGLTGCRYVLKFIRVGLRKWFSIVV